MIGGQDSLEGAVDKLVRRIFCLQAGKYGQFPSEVSFGVTDVQVEALAGEALARIASHPALLLPKLRI